LRVLDYIRIVGVSDICTQSSNVTYNIVYSEESAFSNPKRGVFTLGLSDFIDTPNLDIKRGRENSFSSQWSGVDKGKGGRWNDYNSTPSWIAA